MTQEHPRVAAARRAVEAAVARQDFEAAAALQDKVHRLEQVPWGAVDAAMARQDFEGAAEIINRAMDRK